ncbi:MAG: hypothetical protein RBU37_07305 [Myxococcota bacterium]|jgi:hypothetical protein|nr:hypothetical protein [Myxococcota bacterium]
MADATRSLVKRMPAALVVGTLAMSAIACTEDFTPESEINYLRILGVQADRPRLAANESTFIDALVVSTEDRDFELSWEFCAFTGSASDGYPCVFPEGTPPELIDLLKGEGSRFFFLYPGELVPFVDAICEQSVILAEQLPEGIGLPSCSQGYPARIRLTATDPVSGESQVAVKTLYLLPSAATDEEPNRNPRISSFGPGPEEAETAKVGEAYELRCELDLDSLDYFVRQSETEASQEEALLSWYVRNGSLDEEKTFYTTVVDEPEKAFENKVTPKEAGTTTVWCVIRDGRGGSAWRQLDITVE